MTGDELPRTLYVGNLSPLVTEDLLMTLFSQIGECRNCKIIHEPGNDPYAFIEFSEHQSAAQALAAMNKRQCLGKEMKVNWATTSGHQGKVDTNFAEQYHIFVGDLAPEIDQQTLRNAFAPFGEISDVKIMKDPHTLQHKGYGFISFANKVEAETAIASMNGQWLGTRKIRTNWATRKVQPIGGGNESSGGAGAGIGAGGMMPSKKFVQKLDFNEIWNRSSDSNTTVYCGGINGITEDLIRNTFAPFGAILAVHAFSDRGYAFIRFTSKEAACHAICGVHGMEINGCTAKCSWGKENIDITNVAAAVAASNQTANTNAAVAAAAAANSLYNQAGLTASSIQNTNTAAGNPWAAGASNNPNWAAANYQWATAAGYPPNTMNYWQYPGYQSMMQGWGVMPTAATTGANSQYQMGQNPQGYNGKS